MTRFPCLLLDANVVIFLFHQGLWQAVVERCDLTLAQTVVDEAIFFVDDAGVRHDIDLQPDISAGRVTVIDLPASDVAAFRARFDPLYVQKLDDGETESLTYCISQDGRCHICSSDGIVFRVLSVLDRSEDGVSLEEILQAVGLTRPLNRQYTKAFREEHKQRGFEDRLAGIGLK